MTETATPTLPKITYATLRNDNEALHEAFDRGIEAARAQLGQHHPNFIDGEPRHGEGEFEDRSPIDQEVVLGWFAKGTRQDAKDAIAAARVAYAGWSGTPWPRRFGSRRGSWPLAAAPSPRPRPASCCASEPT